MAGMTRRGLGGMEKPLRMQILDAVPSQPGSNEELESRL
jgi:hypothetical protein